MNTLLTIKEQDVNPEAPEIDATHFHHRQSARAIIQDSDGRIALLRLNKYASHKLPGGGVEEGENIHEALVRELLEETGCVVQLGTEVGIIIEQRDQVELIHTSYCFLATQVGEKVAPTLTDFEKEQGVEMVWAQNLDEAIQLLQQDIPTSYAAKFIKMRELAFLKAARMQNKS